MKTTEESLYSHRFKNILEKEKIWKVLVSDFFQNFISKRAIVLDVAAGYCEFINNIECSKKFALDLNPQIKKYARKDVRCIVGKSTKIHLRNTSVDIVFVSNFFEHITKEDIIKTIKEFKRVLKKGGKVLILQPNIRFTEKNYWMFFDHITPIDDRALIEIFETFEFRTNRVIEKFLPFTTKSSFPKNAFFVKAYLNFPFLWELFGQQSFLVFQK
jgi:ubiquinone/menaquinone biosynthesis C-methylase UbiE